MLFRARRESPRDQCVSSRRHFILVVQVAQTIPYLQFNVSLMYQSRQISSAVDRSCRQHTFKLPPPAAPISPLPQIFSPDSRKQSWAQCGRRSPTRWHATCGDRAIHQSVQLENCRSRSSGYLVFSMDHFLPSSLPRGDILASVERFAAPQMTAYSAVQLSPTDASEERHSSASASDAEDEHPGDELEEGSSSKKRKRAVKIS